MPKITDKISTAGAVMHKKLHASKCYICVVIRVTFTTRNFMVPSLFKNFSL